MNKAVLIGNLTKDPDVRSTSSGISVCTFTVAVQRRFTNAAGEREADFIPVVCWRALAENCGKYLKKGRKVAVLGSIQTRTYDAQDGTRRYVTEVLADEVEFIDRSGGTSGEQHSQSAPSQPSSPFGGGMDFGDSVEDEELPF